MNNFTKTKKIIINIRNYIRARIYFKNINYYLDESSVLLINTPMHGNLGDQLIAQGTIDFLNEGNKTFIEVPRDFISYFEKNFKVNKNTKILVHGGGYFGTLYPVETHSIIKIVESYPENDIYFLPQTLFFASEREELEVKFLKTLNSHDRLTFFARESKSYLEAKKLNCFKNVFLKPDMGMYFFLKGNEIIEKKNSNISSKSIFLIRSDLESIITDKEREDLSKFHSDFYHEKIFKDTKLSMGTVIYPKDRQVYLKEFFSELGTNNLIITDRQHGIIFAAILKNSCLFFDNKTKKSSHLFKEWLEPNFSSIAPFNTSSIIARHNYTDDKNYDEMKNNMRDEFEGLFKKIFIEEHKTL